MEMEPGLLCGWCRQVGVGSVGSVGSAGAKYSRSGRSGRADTADGGRWDASHRSPVAGGAGCSLQHRSVTRAEQVRRGKELAQRPCWRLGHDGLGRYLPQGVSPEASAYQVWRKEQTLEDQV